MANASGPEPVQPIPLYDDLPDTGVRPRVVLRPEQPPTTFRWSAVIAGLFVAAGTQILLSLFGVALGATLADVRVRSLTVPNLGVGVAAWMGLSSLFALALGGFTAARLSGARTRLQGTFAGLLTWTLSIVLASWLVASGSSASSASSFRLPVDAQGAGLTITQIKPQRASASSLIDSAAGAWIAFGSALVSLVAAAAGGAFGAGVYSTPRPDEPWSTPRDMMRE